MADFKALLNVKASAVEKPKPIPQGTFIGTILKHEFGESSAKKTPKVTFEIQPNSPCDDVDEDDFNAFGGQSKLSSKKQKYDFYLTDDSLFRLTDFMRDVCKIEENDRTIMEMIPDTTGIQVKFHITHELYNGDVRGRIDDFAAVE